MFSLATTPVFANAAGTLALHPAGYLRLGFAPGSYRAAKLAELLIQGEEMLLAHGWHLVLADARQLEAFTPEVMCWLRCEWLMRGESRPPNIVKAVVMPNSPEACAAIGLLRNIAPALTRYSYFVSEAAAHEYLLALLAYTPRERGPSAQPGAGCKQMGEG